MDLYELNKKCSRDNIERAEYEVFTCKKVSRDCALTLILWACKNYYGSIKTLKIIRSFGVKKL